MQAAECHRARSCPATLFHYTLRLFALATLLLVLYVLASAPIFKLAWDYPALTPVLGPAFRTLYEPVLLEVASHPYSAPDRFLYWYYTSVWEIPMVRN